MSVTSPQYASLIHLPPSGAPGGELSPGAAGTTITAGEGRTPVPIPANVGSRLPSLASVELRGVTVQGQLVRLACSLEGGARYVCSLDAH